MPLREDILNPIPGDNPSGQSLRSAPIYDSIKEARREDDNLAQGAWQTERKLADWVAVIRLTQETIAEKSKDLQLAAWLTEALLRKQGMHGLRDGLDLCTGLLEKFWDTMYPEIEDGDLELRAGPLGLFGAKLPEAVRALPLNNGGHDFNVYRDSRKIQYEDQAKTKEEKAAREKAITKEGKLPPEVFDKAFNETPKAFYAALEKDIDAAAIALVKLDKLCEQKFDDPPGYGKLRDAIAEFRQVSHSLLQKKRETEPDPVEEVPPEAAAAAPADAADGGGAAAAPGMATALVMSFAPTSEPADRREAIANVVAAANLIRHKEPYSPAPYLMLRGLRWGELRASSDPAILQAPPGDVRQQVKSLALNNRWADLLDWAENIMSQPYSRAWLDLQRFVVEACVALGDDYNSIAIAIRSDLRALVRDLPHLMDATLTDDTPAANPETQKWLRELLGEPEQAVQKAEPSKIPVMDNGQRPGWQKKFVDAHALALEAMRAQQPAKAVTILQREVERQLSGRGRFQRKLQLAQICIAAGKDAIAQPLLDDLAATIETHKLEEWEDKEMVATALTFLVQNSKKISGDAKAKQAIFERICRLDPVQALSI